MKMKARKKNYVRPYGFRTAVPKKAEVVKKYSSGQCIDVGYGDGNYLPCMHGAKIFNFIGFSIIRLKRVKKTS